MTSSNPLSLEQLFTQLHQDIDRHFKSPSRMPTETLRIKLYSRLIKAHPENTHDNPAIPSTTELMDKIDAYIEAYATYNREAHLLATKAYTRIIVGRR